MMMNKSVQFVNPKINVAGFLFLRHDILVCTMTVERHFLRDASVNYHEMLQLFGDITGSY